MANVKIYTNQGATGMFIERNARLTLTGKTVDGIGGVIDAIDGTILGLPPAVIVPGSITRTDLGVFFSGVLVGEGGTAGQYMTIAHGLGVNPGVTGVFVSVFNSNVDSNWEFSNLTTDATNVYIRADDDITFQMQVWAP